MAVSPIKGHVIIKDISVTTAANTSVSPFGAYADTHVGAISGYNLISVIPIGIGSTNPVNCRGYDNGEGFFTYSRTPITITVRLVFARG